MTAFVLHWHLVRVPFLLDADREKALADEEKRAGGLQKKLDEARTKYEVGRPRFALEVLDVDLHAATRTDYFFWITNCGERSARYVTFDPIGSKSAFHAIRFDAQPTLAPQKRVPLTFCCGGDDNWIMDGNVGRLLLFFEDNPNKESTLSYDIVVKSFDGDVHLEEHHALRCELSPGGRGRDLRFIQRFLRRDKLPRLLLANLHIFPASVA